MATKDKIMLEFRLELLTEDKSYLGKRVGDILNGIQDLEQNSQNMGTREQTNSAEAIVNQIRRILHTNWPRDDRKHLEVLQKIGVAIMKSIEEKGDLPTVISDSGKEIQQVLEKLGVTVNNLGSPDTKTPEDPKATAKSQGEESQQNSQSPPVPPEVPTTDTPAVSASPPTAGSSAPPIA